jgi:hypothetical protein
VVDAVNDLKAVIADRGGSLREIVALTRLPEWAALEDAVAKSDEPVTRSALWQVQRLLESYGAYATEAAFILGFELGHGLGEYAMLDAVNAAEVRRASAGGKPDLRAFIREIIVAEPPPIRPYVLAESLIAERDAGSTALGRKLRELGLASSAATVGAMISEIAKAARLLES